MHGVSIKAGISQTRRQTFASLGFASAIAAALYTNVALATTPRTHDITIDDYFTVAVVTGCQASPDGQHIAYTEMRWEDAKEKRNTDLWVVEVASKSAKRLTFDKTNESSPRWSPDGRYIYFTAGYKRGEEKDPPYNGKSQVWRMAPDGGEPQAITRVKDGVGSFEVSKNGQSLYFLQSEENVEDDWKDLRKQYKDLEYGHGVVKVSQLWKLDLATWRSEKIVDEKRVIREFAVSPDEQRIAMITTPDETLLSNEGWSRVDVYDAGTKKVSTLPDKSYRADASSPYGWLDGLTWSGDSQALVLTVSFDGYPPEILFAEGATAAMNFRRLARPPVVSVNGGSTRFRGSSRDLYFTGEERARQRVFKIADVRGDKQGQTQSLTAGDVVIGNYDFLGETGSSLAMVLSTPDRLEDVYTLDGSGTLVKITDVNPQMADWKLPTIQLVTWKGAGGEEVEGILELPPDAKPGEKLPLVVEIHGGPTAATPFRFTFNIYGRTTLPAKGYAVLSPNYRGSTGYGDKFMTDLIGHENDVEVEDIIKGVDAMIERGIADPERLAVMGWSNGGYLTNCLITHDQRFKAASTGAGVLDMVIQWGTEDTPGHVINYMKALPWSDAKAYEDASPLYQLNKVKTPTLIHVGANDERVPAAHARALYRGLKHYLNIPTELVVYPGEGHGLTKYENRKAKMAWDMGWFDKYLMNKTPEPKSAEKKQVN